MSFLERILFPLPAQNAKSIIRKSFVGLFPQKKFAGGRKMVSFQQRNKLQ